MSQIRTKPATEEYREGWERVFGNKDDISIEVINMDASVLTVGVLNADDIITQ